MQRYKVRGEWSDPPFLTIGFAEMVMLEDYARLLASHKKLVELLSEAVYDPDKVWLPITWNIDKATALREAEAITKD